MLFRSFFRVLTYRLCCNVQTRLTYSKSLSARPPGSIPCPSCHRNPTICGSLCIFQATTRPGHWFVTNRLSDRIPYSGGNVKKNLFPPGTASQLKPVHKALHHLGLAGQFFTCCRALLGSCRVCLYHTGNLVNPQGDLGDGMGLSAAGL